MISASVVAESSCFENDGPAEPCADRSEIVGMGYGDIGCCRNANRLEELFLTEPILSDGQCSRRRTNPAHRAGPFECLDRNVFDIESHYVDLSGELAHASRIVDGTDQYGPHLTARGVSVRVEKQAAYTEPIPSEGEHAAELPRTDDPHLHSR